MDGVLVTGTEAGVGKTLVSAALVRSRPGTVYVKPVQTGLAGQRPDVDVVRELTGCAVRQGRGFQSDLAPDVAARDAGVAVRRADLLAPFSGLSHVVGEGDGGLLVDLGTDGTTLADLAVDLSLPLVVVCRPGPGTLNHARLTLEAAWARGIRVHGVVANGWPHAQDRAAQATLEALSAMAPLLAVIPTVATPGAEDLPEIAW